MNDLNTYVEARREWNDWYLDLVRAPRGRVGLVNYRVRLPCYVVDRLFDTAVLIVGVGRQQDRVTIRRKADGQ
jgi:hypothetical protein